VLSRPSPGELWVLGSICSRLPIASADWRCRDDGVPALMAEPMMPAALRRGVSDADAHSERAEASARHLSAMSLSAHRAKSSAGRESGAWIVGERKGAPDGDDAWRNCHDAAVRTGDCRRSPRVFVEQRQQVLGAESLVIGVKFSRIAQRPL